MTDTPDMKDLKEYQKFQKELHRQTMQKDDMMYLHTLPAHCNPQELDERKIRCLKYLKADLKEVNEYTADEILMFFFPKNPEIREDFRTNRPEFFL